jgi:hypothetical protein
LNRSAQAPNSSLDVSGTLADRSPSSIRSAAREAASTGASTPRATRRAARRARAISAMAPTASARRSWSSVDWSAATSRTK